MKMFWKNKKGFTLVELMVVVAILGILVAVAVPVFNSVTESAEETTCQANQRTIESAIMQVRANGNTFGSTSTIANLAPTYLAEEPNCPSGGSYSVTNATGLVTCTAGH